MFTVSYSILLTSTKLNKSVSVRVGSFIFSKEIVYGFVIIPVIAITPLPSPTVTEFPALVVKTALSSVFTPSLSTLPTFTLNVIVSGNGVPILVLPDEANDPSLVPPNVNPFSDPFSQMQGYDLGQATVDPSTGLTITD